MAKQKREVLPDDEVVVSGGLKFSKIIVWIMYVWVLIGVIALALRVFLLATSASTVSGFGKLVMQVSSDYLQPFRGMFPNKNVGETGYLDVSAIFAIIIYLFVLWGFKSLINYVQNKIDLDVYNQKMAINEAKRKAEIAKQEEAERQAKEDLKHILGANPNQQVKTKRNTKTIQ
jgi:uncharacterized protein YggT (Ycf19 family)